MLYFYDLCACVDCWFFVSIRWVLNMSFWLHSFCSWWEDWVPVNRFKHSSWVAVASPTDSPYNAAVRIRCVIKDLGGVSVLSLFCFKFSVSVLAFVIGLTQIFVFFSCYSTTCVISLGTFNTVGSSWATYNRHISLSVFFIHNYVHDEIDGVVGKRKRLM